MGRESMRVHAAPDDRAIGPLSPLRLCRLAFQQSLLSARRRGQPFRHWILTDALPADVIKHLVQAPFATRPPLRATRRVGASPRCSRIAAPWR